MNEKSKRLITVLSLLCLFVLCFDLVLSMTKVTILTKVNKTNDIALKLETEKIIYVSPNGDDSLSGESETQAKLTLQGAIDEAKNHINEKNVTIKMAKGNYKISDPITINQDSTSGENKYKLKIEGASNGKTTIDGGEDVTTPWVLDSQDNNNVWKTAVGMNRDITSFFVDGQMKEVAKTKVEPVGGNFTSVNSAAANVDYDRDIISGETSKIRLLINIDNLWHTISLKSIGRNDNGSARLNYSNESNAGRLAFGKQYVEGEINLYLSNSKKFLDEEGEFYYDKTKGYLYYYTAKNPNQSSCVIPVSNGMIKITGTDDKFASNIEIEKIAFKYGKAEEVTNFWNAGEEMGYVSTDGETASYVEKTSEVKISKASNIRIDGCRFENMESNCINIGNNCYNVQVYNTFFEKLGGYAIKVGNVSDSGFEDTNNKPLPEDLTEVYSVSNELNNMPGKIAIINNRIQGVGLKYDNVAAISVKHVKVLDLKKNDILNTPYSGIKIGNGKFNSHKSLINENDGSIQVEQNKLLNTCTKTFPSNPIYITGPFTSGGLNLQENYIVGQTPAESTYFNKTGGIYLDTGSEAIYVNSNVVSGFENWINERAIYPEEFNEETITEENIDEKAQEVLEKLLTNIEIAGNFSDKPLSRYSFTPDNSQEMPDFKSFDASRNEYSQTGQITSVRTEGEANGMISAQNVENVPFFSNLNITDLNVIYDYDTNLVGQETWNEEAQEIIENAGATLEEDSDLEGPMISTNYEHEGDWITEEIEVLVTITDDSGIKKAVVTKEGSDWFKNLELDEQGNSSFVVEDGGT